MKKDSFPFGANVTDDPQHSLDFNAAAVPMVEHPAHPPEEDGSIPIQPLQDHASEEKVSDNLSKSCNRSSGVEGSQNDQLAPGTLIRAVNACDVEHNEIRVPTHPYSRLCNCDICSTLRKTDDYGRLVFGEPEEIVYGTYEAKQLRFDRIFESEARRFIVPRNYLRRWFVGATLCFGAFSPERYLVAACVLSAPAAHSKRFTARNTKEIRRFVMLDCCGRNSESRFLSWILRSTKQLCPHLRYILTFGNPKYDKETPYRAAGFQMDGIVSCDAQWISHKSHRAREAAEDKHRYVYIFR